MKKALDANGQWDAVRANPDLMDHLAHALTFYKTDEDIRDYLIGHEVAEAVIEAVAECDGFAKTSNLSLVALKKIIPHLERGLLYSEACEAAGYNYSPQVCGGEHYKLPRIPAEMIRNPVVLRALTQARKVVNAVIDRYGSPTRIHIELARDMGRSAEERNKITRKQKENEVERKEVAEQFRKLFSREPKGADILAWRLYWEQGRKCAYSMQPIELTRLFEPHYVEIDHILPYSRSFDNSRSNRVLVLYSENQKKGNRIPYEAFGGDVARWGQYEQWVNATIRDPKKRANLLRKNFDERAENEWKARNLNDTSWISREFASFLGKHLLFADPNEKLPVRCVNGRVVARVRGLWGLEKYRDEDDLHHAQDAAVIAAILPRQVELITAHAKANETRSNVDLETGEIIEWHENDRPRLPMPWPEFRRQVLDKLPTIIVSRMPQRKVTGALHAETIRSAKRLDRDRVSVVKRPLTSLSASDLANLFDPEHNEKLYALIRERMARFGNNAQKAFAEPLYKPRKDGTDGPIVRSVKVTQPQYTGVPVRKGIADNGDMIRTDVFRKRSKTGKTGKWQYYLVPVYVADRARYLKTGDLPNRAIAHSKPYEEWPVIDDSYEFMFSLYPYDLVRIGNDLYYYKSSHRGTGALIVGEPNNLRNEKSLGARNATLIEKLQMGVLGDYYPVRKETRLGLANDSDLQSGEAEG